jgi:predicted acyltransferase
VTSPDGAKITVTQFIYTNWFVPWAGELNGSLFYAIAYISIWLGLAWLLYWRKIFIKV